jgi:hypothetical protein
VLDPFAFDLRAAHQLDAALTEPRREPAEGLKRVRLVRLNDDTDAFD